MRADCSDVSWTKSNSNNGGRNTVAKGRHTEMERVFEMNQSAPQNFSRFRVNYVALRSVIKTKINFVILLPKIGSCEV